MQKKGKPPVKPQKPVGKAKIIVEHEDADKKPQDAGKEAKEGSSSMNADTKAKSKAEVKTTTKGDTSPLEWDTYSQGKWRCNGCDLEFRHFCPQLSSHISQTKHNFSLYDVATGEKKASSISEARLGGLFGKPPPPQKKKRPINQSGGGAPPPEVQQKTTPIASPVTGGTPKEPPATPPPPALPDRVAKFMADNPELVQWITEHPGEAPPTDLSLEGNPQPGSLQVLKFVAKTIEVPSILLVFYQMDLASLQEEGCQPTLDEWVEQVIVQFHVDHAEELGFADFIQQYIERR